MTSTVSRRSLLTGSLVTLATHATPRGLHAAPPPVSDPNCVFCQIVPVAARIGRAIKSSLRADGLSLRQNNEKAGDQTVFHFHIHLIPRWEGKEVFKTLVDPPRATPEQLESAVAPIRKALASK